MAVGIDPYLPRLALEWRNEHDAERARALDGTLVSVDISGFTALSERLAAKGKLGAEELILVISGIFEGLIGIAGRRGGDVLKFRGDALLMLFAGADHAVRACRASAEMQWLIENAGPTTSSVGSVQLRMSVGVHSGLCTFFLVGSGHRELLVTGPASTRTIQLEDLAEAGEIVVSDSTAAALPDGWVGDPREEAYLLRPPPDEEAPPPAFEPAANGVGDGLEAFLPEPLRAPLALGAVEAEHRHVTAAFLKFGGVDELIRTEGHEAALEPLAEVGRLTGEVVADLGITWLESDIDVDGGKLYLVAGAPATTGADEERMLRALRRIIDASPALPIKAGVNRGPVFAGEIGSSARRTYAVMGDTVNLAARLTGRAHVGQILATGDVLERSRTRFETEQQPFLVKGKERAITAFRVGAIAGVREEELAVDLPLAGREHELETLRAAVDGARKRTSQLVELVGDPGIGKSRLLQELKGLALGFTQLSVQCEPYSASAPYVAFRSVLRQLAGITPEQSPEEAGEQLQTWIGAVMPDLAPWLPLLAIPFDAVVPLTPETDEIDTSFRRERGHEVVEQFMERVLMMPTLLVFEDAHWLDDASHQLLLHLAGRPAPRPWLVAVSRRPEGAGFVNGTGVKVELEPLPPEETTRLALAAAGEHAIPEQVLAALTERAGGNPLFVRELVAASADGDDADALPETVESLITTRIDRLDPGDRILLRYASVVGPTFELDLLAEIIAEETVSPLELERWDRLAEFVAWESAETLRFRHDLFRAVGYEGLSFRRRRAIHGSVADALEARAGEHAEEIGDLLSLHFFRAEHFEKAWTYAATAGRRAQEKYANAVAAELYERAIEAARNLSDVDRADVAQVAEALGDVCELYARYDRGEAAYEEALWLVGTDKVAQARLMHKQGIIRERIGRYEEALDWYTRALAATEQIADDVEAAACRVRLELGMGAARRRQGRYEDSMQWGERALANAERIDDKASQAHAYYQLDIVYTRLGRVTPRYLERALEIYEEIGDFVGQAHVLNNLGVGAYFEGRWGEALDAYRRSGELSKRAGDVVSGARASMNEGEILSDQGKLDEADQLFGSAVRVFKAGRFPLGAWLATSDLGRAAARGGRFGEARRLLEEALAGFRDIDSGDLAVEAQARLAECHVLAGDYAEALTVAAEAFAAATALGGAKELHVQLARSYGYALVQARRKDEAKPHFEESLRLARELKLDYDLALTLKALADTGAPEHEAEAREILARLGVERVAAPPLP